MLDLDLNFSAIIIVLIGVGCAFMIYILLIPANFEEFPIQGTVVNMNERVFRGGFPAPTRRVSYEITIFTGEGTQMRRVNREIFRVLEIEDEIILLSRGAFERIPGINEVER